MRHWPAQRPPTQFLLANQSIAPTHIINFLCSLVTQMKCQSEDSSFFSCVLFHSPTTMSRFYCYRDERGILQIKKKCIAQKFMLINWKLFIEFSLSLSLPLQWNHHFFCTFGIEREKDRKIRLFSILHLSLKKIFAF